MPSANTKTRTGGKPKRRGRDLRSTAKKNEDKSVKAQGATTEGHGGSTRDRQEPKDHLRTKPSEQEHLYLQVEDADDCPPSDLAKALGPDEDINRKRCVAKPKQPQSPRYEDDDRDRDGDAKSRRSPPTHSDGSHAERDDRDASTSPMELSPAPPPPLDSGQESTPPVPAQSAATRKKKQQQQTVENFLKQLDFDAAKSQKAFDFWKQLKHRESAKKACEFDNIATSLVSHLDTRIWWMLKRGAILVVNGMESGLNHEERIFRATSRYAMRMYKASVRMREAVVLKWFTNVVKIPEGETKGSLFLRDLIGQMFSSPFNVVNTGEVSLPPTNAKKPISTTVLLDILSKCIKTQLIRTPVVVVIDAVDRLSRCDEARKVLSLLVNIAEDHADEETYSLKLLFTAVGRISITHDREESVIEHISVSSDLKKEARGMVKEWIAVKQKEIEGKRGRKHEKGTSVGRDE